MDRCKLCNNLKKKDEDDVRAAFDFTPGQLVESASIKECGSCMTILEGLLCFEDETWSFEDDVRLVYATALGGNDETLSLELYFCDDRPKLLLEFLLKGEDNQEYPAQRFAAIRTRNSTSGHPLSHAGIRWATSVLESCLTDHLMCRSNRHVLLPRRVLAFDRAGDDAITVRIQENDKVWGRYTALSHCWGSTQTCITTSQNLQEFKKSIPWTAMPRTFQDSIIYSLQLGVRHIWIDALCIIQDDPDDWQIESSKMSDIYQNSFVTLAATASKNGQGGCFSLDLDTASPNEYELDSCLSPTSSIMTFQERILSPRVLHICNQELVWECQNRSECECGGHVARSKQTKYFSRVVEKARFPESLDEGHPITTPESNDSDTPGDPREMSDQWHHIVEQYSALGLTKETDRLPALSGLAQRTSSVLGQYVAG
ncbi:uncharacterized protein PAC_18631 [Phialocephala subalpina]|uniref:Heterokaryon incompatibility domain-containing protein n=1 Tax=Phialocephala subalpina TaxID=576137 RepID=A0A1L7XUM6_9HELO|nr:uncharacterized protein PAC_18631 [Phialocephala subalpina]